MQMFIKMVLYNIVTVILLLLLQQVTSQEIPKTAVEGLSTNVDFLCDLDRQFNPLYWDIQGRVYDLYSIPALFTVRGHEGITLGDVDRRMNGWRFQCFTIDPSTEEGFNPGLVTILTVIFNSATPGPNGADLLKPSTQERLLLDYQELQIGPAFTTFGWFYSPYPTSPCATADYEVDTYAQSEIDSMDLTNVMALNTFQAGSMRNITIDSRFLLDSTNSPTFIRISAIPLSNCASSAHFHKLYYSEAETTIVSVEATSATFELPVDLRRDASLQLIWSKDDRSQCVCPLVEQFVYRCACNTNNQNSNVIAISNHTVTVSNLTQGNGNVVTVYLASSVSSGCQNSCDLRSIQRVYKITQGNPQAPINDSNTYCLSIPNNPISPEVYEVNLTDSTGSRTRLSGVYNTSRCLTITSDLHPDVCGPFQLSVAPLNSMGRAEVVHQVLLPNNEPTPCGCYQERVIISSSVKSVSVGLELNCRNSGYKDAIVTVTLTVAQTDTGEAIQDVTLSCNSTKEVNFLKSSTNYTINTLIGSASSGLICSLKYFVTDQDQASENTTLIAVISVVIIILVVILISGIIIGIVARRFRRMRHLPISTSFELPLKNGDKDRNEDEDKNEHSPFETPHSTPSADQGPEMSMMDNLVPTVGDQALDNASMSKHEEQVSTETLSEASTSSEEPTEHLVSDKKARTLPTSFRIDQIIATEMVGRPRTLSESSRSGRERFGRPRTSSDPSAASRQEKANLLSPDSSDEDAAETPKDEGPHTPSISAESSSLHYSDTRYTGHS